MAAQPTRSLLKNILAYINNPGRVDPDRGLKQLTGRKTPVRKQYRRN